MKKTFSALSLAALVSFPVFAGVSVAKADDMVAVPIAISAPVTVTSTVNVFNANLGIGAKNEDVRQLQIFLNKTDATRVASAPHAGSAGKETSAFGPATEAAVKAYQTAHSLPVTGVFGPLTRASVNAELSKASPVVSVKQVPSTPTLKMDLSIWGQAGVATTYDGAGENPTVWFMYGSTPTTLNWQSAPVVADKTTGLAQVSLLNIGTGDCYVQSFVMNSAGISHSEVARCAK